MKKGKSGKAPNNHTKLQKWKFLENTRKQDREAAKHEEALASEPPQSQDDRTAWRQWLMSACQEIPAEGFRQFQRDSFDAAMRYMPRQPLAPGTRMQPPPQQLQLPQQQQQYQHLQQSQTHPGFVSMLQRQDQSSGQQMMGWQQTGPQPQPYNIGNIGDRSLQSQTRSSSAPVIQQAFTQSSPDNWPISVPQGDIVSTSLRCNGTATGTTTTNCVSSADILHTSFDLPATPTQLNLSAPRTSSMLGDSESNE